MKKLKLIQQAILLIVSVTALLVASCSKDKLPVFGGHPNYQLPGSIVGYVLPPDANANVFLYRNPAGFDDIVPPGDVNGLVTQCTTDEEGLFTMENIPAGSYILDVIPINEEYRGIELDVTVTPGNTIELNISLLKKGG